MSAAKKSSLHRKISGCFLTIIAIPLAYYLIQILLRTPPLAPVQVIAHRGGPAYAPENTLPAFENAIAQGVDWLEFDVQMTQDGQLVVIHDETLDRTTNGTGPVAGLTLEQLRQLDAGQGEQIPTFQEVVELAKESGVKIMPETKSAHLYPGVEEKMLRVLEEAGYQDRTAVQSFESESLETLRELDPGVQRCALSGLWKLNLRNPPAGSQLACPMAEMVLLNPLMVRQAHADGRQVFVYFGLFENPFMFKAMRYFGVDGQMSDDPMALKAALGMP